MFLILDVETGGLDSRKHSLLEVAAIAVDRVTLEQVGSFQRYVRPPDGESYVVSAGALEVNGINLAHHYRTATPVSAAALDFTDFLIKHSGGPGVPPTMRPRYTPVGWNVEFDIRFLFDVNFVPEIRDTFLNRRSLDLQSVAQFLQFAGVLPARENLRSLASYIRYYDLAPAQTHTALDDCVRTLEIFRKFRDELRGSV